MVFYGKRASEYARSVEDTIENASKAGTKVEQAAVLLNEQGGLLHTNVEDFLISLH